MNNCEMGLLRLLLLRQCSAHDANGNVPIYTIISILIISMKMLMEHYYIFTCLCSFFIRIFFYSVVAVFVLNSPIARY